MSRTMNVFLANLTTSARTAVPLNQQLPRRERSSGGWLITPMSGTPVVQVPQNDVVVEPEVDLTALRDEARLDGEREGLKAAQDKIETLAQRYVDAIARLEEATQSCARPSSNELVDLALAMAAELVGHELTVDRDILLETVTQALDGIDEKRGIIVRLGKADLAYLTQRRPELLESGCYFVEDEALGIGGCVVETQQKIVDLSIQRRLEAVRETLRQVLSTERAQ